MTKFVSTPNILWMVEISPKTCKELGPTIRFMGLKFHLSFFHFMEVGAAKIQVILECMSESEASTSRTFNIDAGIQQTDGVRYMTQTGVYESTYSQWCIWTDFVSNISKTLGDRTNLIFSIIITPIGDFGSIFSTDEPVEENKEMTPCEFGLCEDIGSLFNNAEYSDLTIICGEKNFFVHKAILSARSDYFADMIRHEMKEGNVKEKKIEKIEPDILELVLDYLYTGELPPMPKDSLKKVYSAADMYLLEPLKIRCHSLLVDDIITDSNKNTDDATKSKQPGVEQSETDEKKGSDVKDRQMFKNLFMSSGWKLFSEGCPHRAEEMCKPYFTEQA